MEENHTEVCDTVFFLQLPAESFIYDWLDKIHTFYSVKELHTHISIVMCIIGTICNFCNIVVLTRKTMRAPVNMILTAMACCDTVVLFSNLIYTTHYKYIAYEYCTPANWSYGWVMFLIAHNVVVFQICLKHSYIAIASVIIFVTVFNGPNFLIYKIREDKLSESCEIRDERYVDEPAYIPDQSDLAKRANCLLLRLAVWISGVVFKVVPCILLTIFICLLMKILNEVKKNRIRLAMNNHCDSGTSSFSFPNNHLTKVQRFPYRTDRTTRMLLAIVIVFLLTEIPQGILAISLGIFSDDFRYKIYMKIGDILDLLSLCNACTTFIIYCSMSGQFRNEFQRVFLPFLNMFPPLPSARRSSETLAFKFCNVKSEDPQNGCNNASRDRSTTVRSAVSGNSYNWIKNNGHSKLAE
uniref:G_PROTEIN_RECEP_F1_2 domain-containing protein n=1 Tax=Syphacia muris TaxID=451379 RepID=A0A158R4L8_9BILA